MNDARAWLYDQQVARDTAQQVGSADGLLGSVIDDFLAAAQSGLARDSSGEPYSGERLHVLRSALGRVDAELGTMRIEDVRRRQVQSVVDQLYASGWSVDQISEIVDALRALYVYAVQRELVDFSPIVQLRSPTDGPATPPPETVPYQQTPIPAPPAATGVGWPQQTGYNGNGHALTGYETPSGYNTPAGYPANGQLANGHNGNGYSPATLPEVTTPLPVQQRQEDPFLQALTPERVLWWSVLLIVIVAILIAIVLAAESV